MKKSKKAKSEEEFGDLSGRLLYRYVRGSHAYGLQKADGTSDLDEGGVFMEPDEWLEGLGIGGAEQVGDAKGDKVWYSFGKYVRLLVEANPNILESLFVDDRHVLYEHPVMTELKNHRGEFVTRKCFGSLIGYATSQVRKARGLNKKICNPVNCRLYPLDFCNAVCGGRTVPFTRWLGERGMDQRHCGLAVLPNVRDGYAVYYDRGAQPGEGPGLGYRGVVKDPLDEACELRLSDIPAGEKPVCWISYNRDAYSQHCRQWREYTAWLAERNEERYRENVAGGRGMDLKNMMHAVRLLNMGVEIARTGRVNVDRSGIDREFLMNIRNGGVSYDEIMAYVEEKRRLLGDALENSALPEAPDTGKVDRLMIELRRKFRETEKRAGNGGE